MSEPLPVLVITTGGTIDKQYFDALSAYQIGETSVPRLLEIARVRRPFRVVELMRKDSLDLTDADRAAIRAEVNAVAETMIVITHGTDTMVETARAVAQGVQGKTVVLTGAMVPYAFGSSDGLFNLGSALSLAEALSPGVYIAMNGQHFVWDWVKKNRETGVFERI